MYMYIYIYIYIYIYLDEPIVTLGTPQQNYQRTHFTPIKFSNHMLIFEKKSCLLVTCRNILDNDTKILHPEKYFKKSKILEALYIEFKQPTIERINFETSDNILK